MVYLGPVCKHSVAGEGNASLTVATRSLPPSQWWICRKTALGLPTPKLEFWWAPPKFWWSATRRQFGHGAVKSQDASNVLFESPVASHVVTARLPNLPLGGGSFFIYPRIFGVGLRTVTPGRKGLVKFGMQRDSLHALSSAPIRSDFPRRHESSRLAAGESPSSNESEDKVWASSSHSRSSKESLLQGGCNAVYSGWIWEAVRSGDCWWLQSTDPSVYISVLRLHVRI